MKLEAVFFNIVLVCLNSIECQHIIYGGIGISTQRPTTEAPTTPRPPECGVNQILTPKIIGGKDAAECEFPWMVAVRLGSRLCGGTILDSRHILSAGHCFYDRGIRIQPGNVMVEVGSSYLNSMVQYRVANITVHPMYRYFDETLDYDVAVIKLAQDLTFGRCVVPICLPNVNELPTGDCVSTGWGLTEAPSNAVRGRQLSPNILQKVQLPIVDNNICSRNNTYINYLKLCAGDFQNGGIDSCVGDSGGPLICTDVKSYTTRYVQHGIVSGGESCGKAGHPGVFTRVANSEIWNFIQGALV